MPGRAPWWDRRKHWSESVTLPHRPNLMNRIPHCPKILHRQQETTSKPPQEHKMQPYLKYFSSWYYLTLRNCKYSLFLQEKTGASQGAGNIFMQRISVLSDDGSATHTTPDAERGKSCLYIIPLLHLIEKSYQNPRSRRTYGVTQCDGSSIYIELLVREP